MSLPLSAGHFVGPPAIIPRKNRMSLRRSSYRAYYKLRRLLMTLVGLLLSTAVMELCNRQDRIIWMHPRSSYWWKDVVLQSFGPTDWLDNFRVHLITFRPLIQIKTTVMRRPASVPRRVAITLWVLATPSEYRTIAHLFGIARCTVCVIVKETCEAITQKLVHQISSWRKFK